MKKFSKKIVTLALVLLACSSVTLITGKILKPYMMVPPSHPTPDPLVATLTDMLLRYENKEISSIGLATITPFSWDQVHLFGPYTSLSKLDNRFGFAWRKTCFTTIETLEAYTHFVFTEGREVVHCFEYPTKQYEFYPPDNLSGIPMEEAIFILDDKGTPVLIGDE